MPPLYHGSDQLEELIHAQQWKQVLSLCEKRQKKGDQTDELKVVKIHICLRWPDHTRRQQGLRDLEALLARETPVTDIKALGKLEGLVRQQGEEEPKLHGIWERAAGSSPRDIKLLETWFRTKFSAYQYQDAQKAAMAWMKAFPKEHDPFFLFIITAYLVSTSPTIPLTERTIPRNLAFRSLQKAAIDAYTLPERDANGSPGRVLATESDLRLLIRVFIDQGKYEEALSILEDTRTGFTSRVGNQSWEIAKAMIDLQGLCGRWKAQWKTCRRILQEARPANFQQDSSDQKFGFGEKGDDMAIWETLVTACGKLHLKEPIYLCQTKDLIADFGQPMSRNADLASLKLYSQDAIMETTGRERFLEECVRFFGLYCTKETCYLDLQPCTACLSDPEKKDLMFSFVTAPENPPPQDAPNFRSLCRKVTLFKLEYHFAVSRDDLAAKPGVLPSFVDRCIDVYKVSIDLNLKLPVSDRGPADDAMLLASMALIRMYRLGHGDNTLLRSLVILEHLLAHSKHNYDALLILVRLYIYLGAGSLAMEQYSKLSVKNMLHATTSSILYTRISTIHPWPVSVSPSANEHITFDPLQKIEEALEWHMDAKELNNKALQKEWRDGHWDALLEIHSEERMLNEGIAKCVLVVEHKRLQRFRGASQSVTGQCEWVFPQVAMEKGDRGVFPDYEASNQPLFEQILPMAGQNGAYVNDPWLSEQLEIGKFWDCLQSKGQATIDKPRFGETQEATQSIPDTDPRTNVEKILSMFIGELNELYNISSRNLAGNTSRNTAIKERLAKLEATLAERSKWLHNLDLVQGHQALHICPGLKTTLWGLFHDLFMHVDLVLCTRRTLDCLAADKKKDEYALTPWYKTSEKSIRHQLAVILHQVSSNAKIVREEIERSTWSNNLREEIIGDDELGQKIGSLMTDSKTVDNVIHKLKNSWYDALNGLNRTARI